MSTIPGTTWPGQPARSVAAENADDYAAAVAAAGMPPTLRTVALAFLAAARGEPSLTVRFAPGEREELAGLDHATTHYALWGRPPRGTRPARPGLVELGWLVRRNRRGRGTTYRLTIPLGADR